MENFAHVVMGDVKVSCRRSYQKEKLMLSAVGE